MKDLDTGQVSAHATPAQRAAVRAIARELFVKLNHKENQHKRFRVDNVCYGVSAKDQDGSMCKASTVIKQAYPSLLLVLYVWRKCRFDCM